MNLTEAARQWAEQKRIIDDAASKLEEASTVLKEHFRRTGRTDYKGLVGYARTVYQRLDTRLAKAALGKRAEECMVATPRETLSLLK